MYPLLNKITITLYMKVIWHLSLSLKSIYVFLCKFILLAIHGSQNVT